MSVSLGLRALSSLDTCMKPQIPAIPVSTQWNDGSGNRPRHICVSSVTGSRCGNAAFNKPGRKRKKSPRGKRLIVARCSLCATISRCHAERCQPHGSFEPPNNRACKPFSFLFPFFSPFFLSFSGSLKGHSSALVKCQLVCKDHALN